MLLGMTVHLLLCHAPKQFWGWRTISPWRGLSVHLQYCMWNSVVSSSIHLKRHKHALINLHSYYTKYFRVSFYKQGCIQSFQTGYLEQELEMVQLSATRCNCIAILWVSLVNFATITLCVASRVFVVAYFVMTQSGNFRIHPRMLKNLQALWTHRYIHQR
jgi:hypothetical protein